MRGWILTAALAVVVAALAGLVAAGATAAELAQIVFVLFLGLMIATGLVSAARGRPPL